jgi:hypothetical protein|uniref:Uncharacterized protein n=1 Tax=Myoviridae sp. ctfJc17 TaxID=2827612 RepID=A0A8S5LQY0_9CAUD|nr:MAG TPA: hypothetical protein [Myoviridae sp. ctfJc17]
MSEKVKVTVGAKAYSFHDQSTGITIARGEERELTLRQLGSKKIQMALNSGHLRMIADKNKVEKYSASDLDKLEKKLTAQFEKGMEVAKIAKAYTLEELTLIAARHEIVAEQNDTPVTLVQALLEEFEEQSK